MKKTLIFLLTLILLLNIPLTSFAKPQADNKSVKAKSAILMSLDTGEILYKKNEYEHLSPASVTKIMTILLVLEALEDGKIKLSDKVSASENAVSMGGSQIWLEKGEIMSVEELLKAVIIVSANDACTALAEKVAGSSQAFVNMMNKRTRELGLENTHFENSNGLDDTVTNHYSCAYDLAIISREVMKHSLVKKYTTVWLDSLRGGKTVLNNTNKLCNTYNGITGLKTGTTSNAGFCISATATRDNMGLVAVVLGSETSEDRFDTASYLLDWGFASYKVYTPDIRKSRIKSVRVKNGCIKEVKPVILNSNKLIISIDAENVKLKYNTLKSIKAPVKKGDNLGNIELKSGNKTIGKITLVAPVNVEKQTFKAIFSGLLIKI
ncbi:MAG: D-alanyl-D-alanine carboxypeptidase [Eubacterium sp.]|nr:D-alanyl-D-alanine carboxypeptidase [Eubacterium sp.]